MSSPVTLALDAVALARLDAWRVAGGEEEVCGLLVGRRDGSKLEVRGVERVRNLARDRRSNFVLDPGAHVAAEDAARRAGLEVLGAWHTHPGGAPRPSAADREGAWSNRVTLIGGGTGRWCAWWFEARTRAPIELELAVPA